MKKTLPSLRFLMIVATIGGSGVHADEGRAQRARILTHVKDAAGGVDELKAVLAVGEVEVAAARADVPPPNRPWRRRWRRTGSMKQRNACAVRRSNASCCCPAMSITPAPASPPA